MRDLTADSQTSSAVQAASIDLLQDFARFLRVDVAQGDASPETIRNYWGQARAYLEWCCAEGIHPAEASEADVKSYRTYLVHAGYARSTIATRLNAARRLYAMAMARAYRSDNPAAGIRAPKDRTARADRVKWLPLTAVRRVLSAPDTRWPSGLRNRAILTLLALHGLRVVEVARLNVADLDPEAGDGGALAVLGKGGKRRTALLVGPSACALQSWLHIRPEVAAMGEEALFVSLHHPQRGSRLSRRAIRKMVDHYFVQLNLKRDGVSCHSLRHSFATLSRANGAKLDAIARAMGHASVTTTQVYADIVDAAAENPARYLVGALGTIEG